MDRLGTGTPIGIFSAGLAKQLSAVHDERGAVRQVDEERSVAP